MRFTREITSFALAPFAIWVIGWSHEYVFNVVIAIVGVLALLEFINLGKAKGYEIPTLLCIGVMLIILGGFIFKDLSVELGMFVAMLAIPGSYVLRNRGIEDSLPSSAIALLATTYVGLLAGSLIRLRHDFPEGTKLLFFLLLVVWLGDSGAYYFGKALGKHKLSPIISPKKTVEGMFGGMLVSVVTAIVTHFTFFPAFPLLHAIIAAVILSFNGVVGDLAESMWKRSAAVKDSGTILPGHGGFFDRFDSILFTAPILYCYWTLLKHGFSLNIMSG